MPNHFSYHSSQHTYRNIFFRKETINTTEKSTGLLEGIFGDESNRAACGLGPG